LRLELVSFYRCDGRHSFCLFRKLLIFKRKTARPSPKGRAAVSPCCLSATLSQALRLPANREEAGDAKGGVDADETDQDDFDDTHCLSPVSSGLSLSTADERKIEKSRKSGCDGRHRPGDLGK
jgi:hypothetical protein